MPLCKAYNDFQKKFPAAIAGNEVTLISHQTKPTAGFLCFGLIFLGSSLLGVLWNKKKGALSMSTHQIFIVDMQGGECKIPHI